MLSKRKKWPGIFIVRNPLRIFFTSFKKSLQEKLYKIYIYSNTISGRFVLIIINQFYILEQIIDILEYAVEKEILFSEFETYVTVPFKLKLFFHGWSQLGMVKWLSNWINTIKTNENDHHILFVIIRILCSFTEESPFWFQLWTIPASIKINETILPNMFLKVVLEYILQNTTNGSSQLKGFRDFFAERKDDKPFKTQFVEQRFNECKICNLCPRFK